MDFLKRSTGGKRRLATALAGLAAVLVLLSGCGLFSLQPAAPERTAEGEDDLLRKQRFRTRPPIRTGRNLYEGGLWRGAASWGNLMRDHRARFTGDLLTVREMTKIIKVPEPKPEPAQPEAQAQPETPEALVDPVIAFLRDQEKRRERIELEQNEILRSIDQIEVEVQRVLPNGNLLVRGSHPPIFRDRNRVKYIITLRGIVRPSDVDDNNTIPAPKLSKAVYRIRRLVRRSLVPQEASSVARAAGQPRGGEFLDRLTDFLTGSRGSASRPPPP